MTTQPRAAKGTSEQPVSQLRWLDRNELTANDYNPNHVFSAELRLLKLSILENGWTQPIVARQDGEIVDGFHRWQLTADPEIAGLTGGMAPTVYLPASVDRATQIMATIRHNRARGTHAVLRMADIVAGLSEEGLSDETIAHRLGMDEEEVSRLMDRGSMMKRAARADDQMGQAWEPRA